MHIDENTKIILRLHKQANNRGLNIYNPFFFQSGINAVYLLRHNPDPKPLLAGMRNLAIAGAIPAGFEKDASFLNLLDDITEEARLINRVGVVFNNNGKLTGHYQGGIGLYNSIVTKYGSLDDKKIVILGAGTVAKGLLLEIKKQTIKPKITLVNRTIENAEALAETFSELVISVQPFSELTNQQGDLFVDTTDIGSPWNKGEEFTYTHDFVKNFSFVADVTFVPTSPQLIQVAQEAGIATAPGHRMFLYQAEECMKRILGEQDYDLALYEKLMLADFEINWS